MYGGHYGYYGQQVPGQAGLPQQQQQQQQQQHGMHYQQYQHQQAAYPGQQYAMHQQYQQAPQAMPQYDNPLLQELHQQQMAHLQELEKPQAPAQPPPAPPVAAPSAVVHTAPAAAAAPGTYSEDQPHYIYISGIGPATEQDIINMFSQAGHIHQNRYTGEPLVEITEQQGTRIASVVFAGLTGAQNAITWYNGSNLHGYPIAVAYGGAYIEPTYEGGGRGVATDTATVPGAGRGKTVVEEVKEEEPDKGGGRGFLDDIELYTDDSLGKEKKMFKSYSAKRREMNRRSSTEDGFEEEEVVEEEEDVTQAVVEEAEPGEVEYGAAAKTGDVDVSKAGPPGLFKEGDWFCPSCGNINWAKRKNCNVCNRQKPGTEEVRTGKGGGFNERQEPVAKRTGEDSDSDEYNEFGVKKKKFRRKGKPEVAAATTSLTDPTAALKALMEKRDAEMGEDKAAAAPKRSSSRGRSHDRRRRSRSRERRSSHRRRRSHSRSRSRSRSSSGSSRSPSRDRRRNRSRSPRRHRRHDSRSPRHRRRSRSPDRRDRHRHRRR